ncbi:MAG: hypothetical protein KJ574_04970 [Nanoarchaeota archaeon]|nr:hypothetical protein [Nanoarchaeota archaeon]
MAKKSSTKKDVLDRILKAKNRIHMLGVKGHTFTLGETIATLQTRYDVKGLLKDLTEVKKLLDDVSGKSGAIAQHDIVKAESAILAIEYDTVDAADEAYKAIFNAYILLLELLRHMDRFEKDKKLNSKQANELFGEARKEISRVLHSQLAQIDGVYKAFKGGTATALMAKQALTADIYITRYLRMRGEVKEAFHDEKKLAQLFTEKKLPANFTEQMKKLVRSELEQVNKLLTDINLGLTQILGHLNQAKVIARAAVHNHELPAAFGTDQEEIFTGIHGLVEKQDDSVHIFINQIYRAR